MKKRNLKVVALLMVAVMLFIAGCTPTTSTTPTTAPAASTAPAATAAPTAAPAPTDSGPDYTPIAEADPDLPADRYDATVTPRTGANANTPLVLSTGTLDGKFSSFFSTSAYDRDVTDMTGLGLLFFDKANAPLAGVEYPSVAYSYTQEVSEDNSQSVYKFVLKNGLTFSDGNPISAKDVLFTLYTLADPLYDGSSTFYTLKVKGMSEYRLQTSSEALEVAQAILDAGIYTADDGSLAYNAADGATAEQQAAFWSYMDEAGTMFAQDIVDYVLGSYLSDNYVNGYFSEGMTAEEINSDDLKVAFGMALWGFGSYDKETATFTDALENTYVIGTDPLTAADYWANIVGSYGYNLSPDDGINAEKAGSVNVETYVRDLYIANEGSIEGGVASIAGITTGTEVCEDNVEREYIELVFDGVDPVTIFRLGISVLPFHYYTAGFSGALNDNGVSINDPAFIQHLKTKNDAPMGAGPYVFEEYKDNVVYYTANDNYLMGSPKIQHLRYQEVNLGAELDAVKTDTVHFTDPSASSTIINDVTEGEGDYAKLNYVLVDNDGYGYIGINAQIFPEWEVRKALAHAMNVELTIDNYYGELATVNYRTMTKVQWAYPENPENLFPYDGTGETSKALFIEAGYVYDEASNTMKYPEGHEKAGEQVTVKATLPSAASDHPAGSVLIDMQEVLGKIGIKVDIESDTNLLSKLPTAFESGIQIWAAAWGSGGADPDMFQVWYSDPSVNQGTSPSAKGLYWLFQNGSDDQKAHLKEMNEMIMAGRSTLDVEERKVIYARALELSTGTATEIPTYQRKNMYVYNKSVINPDSLLSGDDVTPFQSPISFIWEVELND